MIELLSDTGLGKEMHSVISQGRVESMVTSKPRDRRLLIEEAAGLGKHRKRRRRAQLKLERTHDNLDRALDVEREARSRLRPLKRQAEAAELHERLERQTFEIRWELVRDDSRTSASKATAAAGADRAGGAERSQLETELEDRRRAPSAGRGGAARAQRAARGALEPDARRPRPHESGRVPDRVDRRHGARVAQRLEQSHRAIETLQAELADRPRRSQGGGADQAIEEELEALQRDRQAELARQLAVLESELEAPASGSPGQSGPSRRRTNSDAAATAGPRPPVAIREADGAPSRHGARRPASAAN